MKEWNKVKDNDGLEWAELEINEYDLEKKKLDLSNNPNNVILCSDEEGKGFAIPPRK